VVKHQHERTVAAALSHKGIQTLLPLYRDRRTWSDRTREIELPLFPGYVFCQLGNSARVPALSTPGVRSVVSFGRGPAPLDEQEIASLKKLVASRSPLKPWPFLEAGARVRVERGPLRGLEGFVLQAGDAWRVVVSITLLQRSVAAEIDRSLIGPVCGAPTGNR
jgi:transcription antitermination factor NusG